MNKDPAVDELAKSMWRGSLAYAVGLVIAAQFIHVTCGDNEYQKQPTQITSVAERLTRQAETK